MLSWWLEELELGAKNRGIKDLKDMSIDKLLSILDASESIKEAEAIKSIRKESFEANSIPKKKLLMLIRFLKTKTLKIEHWEIQETFSGLQKDIKNRALGDLRNLFRLKKKEH